MAEYAGLEIRIGGNTTKLTNALKASTKSAAELQSRIRQITRAMQFDPNDLRNIETRIKITGDRMQSLQSKTQLTKTAMQQLGDAVVKIGGEEKSIREIANETQNLSLKAKQADERFNAMTGTLAKIYEAWNKFSRSKGVDFLTDQLGFTQADAERLMSGATSVRELATELREIQSLRADPLFSGSGGIISDDDIKRVMQLKQLNFHDMFKRGLELDDVIEEAERLGVVIEDSAISNVRELQKTFKEAQQDKAAFDKALQFEQLGTDLQRLNSEAESLSQTMRSLDDSLTPTTTSEKFQAVEADIRKVDAALTNVERDLDRTGEAMKVDPGNIELAKRYFDDLQQKAALSEEKVGLLRREMDMLDASGASEAAKSHRDIAKWVEESAENARVAQKELSNQRATVANLTDQAKTLEQTISTMKGDSTLATYSDGVVEWQKKVQKLNTELANLEKAERLAAEQQENLGKAQNSFDKAAKDADQYKDKLDELESEFKQLNDAFNSGDPTLDYAAMVQELNRLVSEIEEVKTSYGGASRNVEEFGRKLKDQQERADVANDSLKQQRTRVEELRQAVNELEKLKEVKLFKNPTAEIEETEAELVQLRGELQSAIAKENELEGAYDSAKTENELAKTAQALRDVSKDADSTGAELKKVQDELKIRGDSILNPSTIKSIGMTLSATLTPTMVALGYKMVDASSTVDAAYRDMRKTVEGTEEQFEHLKKSAIEFSRTHVTSADQILQIEAIGGELGIATENLEAFAEAISNISVSTNLDVEGAADALGHLSNILHLTEDDYDGFSDALVRLGNNGASTETEIANIAERIGAMGAIVGMSGSDVLAWASTIASTGQNAEAAGTAISRTMSYMETAVAAAGGTMDTSFEAINAAVEEGGDKLTIFASLAGKTADEFADAWSTDSESMAEELNESLDSAKENLQLIADVAHMSAKDFAKAWEDDPTAVLEAFIKGLNDIEDAEGSADKVLQSLGITAVRQKQAIEGLMQTVGGLDDNLKMSEDAWNGISDRWGQAGDAANEAAKKAEGFSGQMQILKNMAQNFLSELGEGATPWIKKFAGQLEWVSGLFSDLSTDTKKWIVAVGGIAAVAGPAISMLGTFGTAKKEVSDWINTTVSGMGIVKAAFASGGKEAVDALLPTISTMDKVKYIASSLGQSILTGLAIGAVVAGIGLIISELMKLYKQYKDHIAATAGLSDALTDVGKASMITSDGVSDAGSSIRDLAEDARGCDSRIADLARTIEDSNKQYSNFAGKMDYYANTISELGGKADLSKEDMYKLEAALMAVNDACGTTYGLDEYGNIIDTETGKIQDNTEVIEANIRARKQQALIDYYSDDYAQAVGEYAEAQDKLNEAQDKYNDLVSDEGRKKFYDDLKELKGASYDAAEAQATYEYNVGLAEDAIRGYQVEVNKTGDAMRTLEGKISAAEDGLRESNKAFEEAAKAQEELDRRSSTVSDDVTGNMKRMSDAAEKLGTSDSGFNDIAERLDVIHVSAEEMNDVDMSKLISSFDDASGSMEQAISVLEDGGVHMDTWNAALEQAPGAAEKMSTLTGAAFDSMYEVANNDLNNTMTLIAGLDEVRVGDKTFYIGDNGSIVDEQGKVYDIKEDLADIPDEVITTYYVDDTDAMKKTLDVKRELNKTDKQKTNPKIEVTDNATKPTETLQGKLKSVNDYTAKPTATLVDNASGGLNAISNKLSLLNGRVSTVTVTTVEKKVKQATGGFNNRPVIPRHASGYIATGPTLTNQGWIGEDGIEAVSNWATGGTVVPLTNKRYMLPIADAIAEGMAKRGGTSAPVINLYVSCEGGPEDAANAIVRALRLYNL